MISKQEIVEPIAPDYRPQAYWIYNRVRSVRILNRLILGIVFKKDPGVDNINDDDDDDDRDHDTNDDTDLLLEEPSARRLFRLLY